MKLPSALKDLSPRSRKSRAARMNKVRRAFLRGQSHWGLPGYTKGKGAFIKETTERLAKQKEDARIGDEEGAKGLVVSSVQENLENVSGI